MHVATYVYVVCVTDGAFILTPLANFLTYYLWIHKRTFKQIPVNAILYNVVCNSYLLIFM